MPVCVFMLPLATYFLPLLAVCMYMYHINYNDLSFSAYTHADPCTYVIYPFLFVLYIHAVLLLIYSYSMLRATCKDIKNDLSLMSDNVGGCPGLLEYLYWCMISADWNS